MIEQNTNIRRKGKSVGIVEWAELAVYLRVDKKLSEGTLYPLQSKHRILSAFFISLPFNRANFNQFIDSLVQKKYKPAYINNFIKLAKHIDQYMGTGQLQDYSYYRFEIAYLLKDKTEGTIIEKKRL